MNLDWESEERRQEVPGSEVAGGGGGVLSDAWDLGWGVLGVYSEEGEDNLSEDAGDVRP